MLSVCHLNISVLSPLFRLLQSSMVVGENESQHSIYHSIWFNRWPLHSMVGDAAGNRESSTWMPSVWWQRTFPKQSGAWDFRSSQETSKMILILMPSYISSGVIQDSWQNIVALLGVGPIRLLNHLAICTGLVLRYDMLKRPVTLSRLSRRIMKNV